MSIFDFWKRKSVSSSVQPTSQLPKSAPICERIDYAASIARLRASGDIGEDESPVLLDRMPTYDDDGEGLSFFRTALEDETDFSNLTLPRSFFSRSEIAGISFRCADFHESSFCWNDFSMVDFTGAELSGSDFRGSIYQRCKFDHANLSKADFRHTTLSGCSFEGAGMTGAVFGSRHVAALKLSSAQLAEIDVRSDEGPEPDGG